MIPATPVSDATGRIPPAAPSLPDPLARLATDGRSNVDLVTEMAHDLRSPLTSIVALADLMRTGRSGPVTESQRRQLGLMYSAALSLCATASDIIELAKGGDRLVDTERDSFSPAEVFSAVQAVITPMTEVKGLTLQFELPELGRRLGHPKALNRVLLNLATNAIKFTESGFVRIAARQMAGNRVQFSVRDTGPGLDLDKLDGLYDAFKAGPRPEQQRFSRTGLGLAICRRLISAMGSALQIETQPDWGTLFYFELELPRAA